MSRGRFQARIQSPQLENLRDTKIDKILHLHLRDRGRTSNALHTTRRTPVACGPEEKLQVVDANVLAHVNDVPFQGGETPYSMGLVEPNRSAPIDPQPS